MIDDLVRNCQRNWFGGKKENGSTHTSWPRTSRISLVFKQLWVPTSSSITQQKRLKWINEVSAHRVLVIYLQLRSLQLQNYRFRITGWVIGNGLSGWWALLSVSKRSKTIPIMFIEIAQHHELRDFIFLTLYGSNIYCIFSRCVRRSCSQDDWNLISFLIFSGF